MSNLPPNNAPGEGAEPCDLQMEHYVTVVVPVFNEKDNIEPLVETLERLKCVERILIVDDSTDETTAKVADLKRRLPNLTHLRREGGRGLGSAILTGLKYAVENFESSGFLTIDGDFSHNPVDLPRFMKTFAAGRHDVIIGSRYVEGGRIVGWGGHRILVSMTANFLAERIFGLGVRDCTTGFRFYSRGAVETILPYLHSTDYEIQIEALLQARRFGLRIGEIPLTVVKRRSGKSKLGLRQILTYVRALFKLYFKESLGAR